MKTKLSVRSLSRRLRDRIHQAENTVQRAHINVQERTALQVSVETDIPRATCPHDYLRRYQG